MKELEGLHPTLVKKAERLIELCDSAGLRIKITQGYRSIEEQDRLYAQGRTAPGKIVTWARGGESYHNYGLAFDFALYNENKLHWDMKVDVNKNEIPDYCDVGELGESLGLEWGGRWKKKDYPHFQLTFGLSIADLKAGKRPFDPTKIISLA